MGFDVFFLAKDGRPLYIEVNATSQGCGNSFFLSAYEKAFMEVSTDKGLNYDMEWKTKNGAWRFIQPPGSWASAIPLDVEK